MDDSNKKGHLHPLTITIEEVVKAFAAIGFSISSAPEIDTEYYNFDSLNIPPTHSARDMQDTLWVKGDKNLLLRTHVSNNQVRFMEKNKPPFKTVYFGKVFRNEATDATHEMQFHQFEALCVGDDINLGHLKFTIENFVKKVFGADVEMRMRPSFFPFTEPSMEVDIKYGGKWLEVLGAGMVHPKVLENGGIPAKEWRGFAFGVGWDRIAMIKFGINDVRSLYTGDLRLINQF